MARSSEMWESLSIATVMLAPFSALYAAGWLAYEATYRLGLKRAISPHRPVICVGNLTVGGTGKTPTTLYLAKLLADIGRSVVISCSGYGSPASEAARVAPPGELSAHDWGDEAALFRSQLPEVPLVVGRRRVLAAELCHAHFPGSVLLLDDGFQHLPLRKDLSIVLDPPRRNRLCLPAGPYREPRGGLHRADLVLPSEYELTVDDFLVRDPQGERVSLPAAADVLCAIGRPASLVATIEALGCRIEAGRFLPDHDPLSAGNLLSDLGRARPLIVTSKDWMKLRERPDVDGRDVRIVDYTVRIQPEEAFRNWISQRLDEVGS